MLRSIEDTTLISVEKCIQIHGYFQEEGRNKSDCNVVFVDASWWHKGNLDGRKMFEDGPRIKGSIHFDLDDIASQSDLYPTMNPKDLPHMIPPTGLFSAFMDEYNITNVDHIIIYGRETVLFTPRVWFTFKSFGHPKSKLHLMQGSLDDWIEKGGTTDIEKVEVPRAKDIIAKYSCREKISCSYNYKARGTANYIYSMEDIIHKVPNDCIIIDSRGSSYTKGNIPGSYHVPYTSFQTEKSTVIKSVENLKKVFEHVNIDPNTNEVIVCSCGTGVSACTTFLALELCGRDVDCQPTFMYDGSWYEWGKESTTPKEIQQ